MSGDCKSSAGKAWETLEERLTRQFYEWELWGRGWQVWDKPVELEPPFYPFFGHFVTGESDKFLDDGRTPTFFSSLADGLRSLLKRNSAGSASAGEDDSQTAERQPY